MNKLELIDALSKQGGISKGESARIVEIFFKAMFEELGNGGRVEIRGLCTLYIKTYKSYSGRNPKTGEKIVVKAKKLPFFKCGKELKDRVDKNKIKAVSY
jgi:integration host factor subunit beta